MRRTVLLATIALIMGQGSAKAQVFTSYDTVTTAAAAGYSEPNTNIPIFGDAITLSQNGTLGQVGFDLFNSSSGGNTGSILTGTMNIKIYDNTTPYASGS